MVGAGSSPNDASVRGGNGCECDSGEPQTDNTGHSTAARHEYWPESVWRYRDQLIQKRCTSTAGAQCQVCSSHLVAIGIGSGDRIARALVGIVRDRDADTAAFAAVG